MAQRPTERKNTHLERFTHPRTYTKTGGYIETRPRTKKAIDTPWILTGMGGAGMGGTAQNHGAERWKTCTLTSMGGHISRTYPSTSAWDRNQSADRSNSVRTAAQCAGSHTVRGADMPFVIRATHRTSHGCVDNQPSCCGVGRHHVKGGGVPPSRRWHVIFS